MKVRITSSPDNKIAQAVLANYSNITYFSRANGFDLHNRQSVINFVEDTHNYDLTINFAVGYQLTAVNLLMDLYHHCHNINLNHTVLNIGSYLGKLVINNSDGDYEIDKASLKLAHRKIAYSYAFFNHPLDSKMIDIGFIEGTQIFEEYPHLGGISLNDISKNVDYLMNNNSIKEVSVQYAQPGNHRINDGIGPILPLLF